LNRIIYKPGADDLTHSNRLYSEPDTAIELNQILIGLKVNMLTRKVMQQAIDHRSRDASTAQVRSRPDVDEICIAYAIGKRASGSDDLALYHAIQTP